MMIKHCPDGKLGSSGMEMSHTTLPIEVEVTGVEGKADSQSEQHFDGCAADDQRYSRMNPVNWKAVNIRRGFVT